MSPDSVNEATGRVGGSSTLQPEQGPLLPGAPDWSASSIGPVSRWPSELLAAVRTVIASRLPMMIWWGPDLVQIYNEAFTPLLGDKHPVALGQRASDCWPEVWGEVGSLAEGVLAGQGATLSQDSLLFLKRYGYIEETYWTFSYSPIVNDTAAVLGIFVATTDVTDRVVGERRLATDHELGTMTYAGLHSPKEASLTALGIMGRNRPALPFVACYLRVGDQLELVASYGLRSGSPAFPLTVPVTGSSAIAGVARTGRRQMFDLGQLAHPSDIESSPLGPAVPSSAFLSPLTTIGEGAPVGVLMLGVNPYRAVDDAYRKFFTIVERHFSTILTDSRALQEERRRAQLLTELNDSKTRFFQNVSHEFRTPLTLILGALQEPSPSSRGTQVLHLDTLEAARRAALHLDRLVDALLTFAQAEDGALVARRHPSDVTALTRDGASMFQSAIEAAGLTFTIELPSTAAVVSIDPEMWSRIVLNLLSNAYKFTRFGAITVRLTLSEHSAVLEVADTGIGIEPDERDRIFERFHQGVAGSGSRSAPGAGIGLALVSDLVRAHDGHIEVDSQPGRGSTFRVSLPLVITDPAQVGPALVSERLRSHALADIGAPQSSAPPAVSTLEGTQARSRAGRHVLLVEDNFDLRSYIARLLREDGWEVTETADAETALKVERVPDLVLSDIMLPGMDGLALLRTLRAHARLSRIPVILLTARAGAESAAEGLRAGADDYITKPFDPAELLARLAVHQELSCLREFALGEAEKRSANLERALTSNREIGAAIGILMAERKLTSERAFALLREASNRSNRALRDIADHVVLTGSLDLTTREGSPARSPQKEV